MTNAAAENAKFDYIVVGSGAGGGPLAANLATHGFRVLLLEAGGKAENYSYQVPGFHGLASEDPDMRWDYFVKHYADKDRRAKDSKYTAKRDGVLYPRAGTLGGCTAHNAMITMLPHDSDWEAISNLTGDRSWRAANMHYYFQRLERCGYVLAPGQWPNGVLARAVHWVRKVLHRVRYDLSPKKRDDPNPSGHGFEGWLSTSLADPSLALPDKKLLRVLRRAVAAAGSRGFELQLPRLARNFIMTGTAHFDPNDVREKQSPQGLCFTPLATKDGRRNGTREYIARVAAERPDNLLVEIDCLVTQILFDDEPQPRAIGVEYMRGAGLYRATPGSDATAVPEQREKVYTRGEVILSAGAYNSPQLLMLSGIGPKTELDRVGISSLVDLPGVGTNLQDRYEVGVVFEMERDFQILGTSTFAPPVDGQPEEDVFREWRAGRGLYTSNGAVLGISLRSSRVREDPDLFVFGLPGYFRGYYPGYSKKLLEKRNSFTWAVLKAHTRNTGGTVTLKTNDARDVPEIVFHYFDEGSDRSGDDLEAVVDGVELAREIMKKTRGAVKGELVPGPDAKTRDDLKEFVRNEAWGHHASCSNRMGPRTDPYAVVDSNFRVHGTRGLRVVDASVFPRIPGFFIVTAIYMISEKATDVIIRDAAEWKTPSAAAQQA